MRDKNRHWWWFCCVAGLLDVMCMICLEKEIICTQAARILFFRIDQAIQRGPYSGCNPDFWSWSMCYWMAWLDRGWHHVVLPRCLSDPILERVRTAIGRCPAYDRHIGRAGNAGGECVLTRFCGAVTATSEDPSRSATRAVRALTSFTSASRSSRNRVRLLLGRDKLAAAVLNL